MNLFLQPGYRFPDPEREKARAELQSNPKFQNWKLVQSLIYDPLPASLATTPTATPSSVAIPTKTKPPTRAKKLDGKHEEKHYSTAEIAEAWGISPDFVRDLFKEEPGVLKFERPQTKYKRAHATLRVPESVMLRVHNRVSGS